MRPRACGRCYRRRRPLRVYRRINRIRCVNERNSVMPIKVGDRLPDTKFRVMTGEGPAWKTTDEIFKGKKVALFAVPGAFTGVCHKQHLPTVVANVEALKAKGVNTIAVTGVNDISVMDA